MSDSLLLPLRNLIQEDVAGRGLCKDPRANLVNACPDDFAAACRSLADTPHAKLLVVTGFHIAHAKPPCSETDGPLGALFLARALVPLGIQIIVATDGSCVSALNAGLEFCHLQDDTRVIQLPREAWDDQGYQDWVFGLTDRINTPLTHLLAIERVGPSHTLKSLQAQPALSQLPPEYHRLDPPAEAEGQDERILTSSAEIVLHNSGLLPKDLLALCRLVDDFAHEVPPEQRNRCHSMRGLDITHQTSPAHLLFENAAALEPPVVTIGIGDGGNEIGMGKIAWDIIRRNIPNGARIACRVPTDHLIVCGVSNWGAYGLGAGVRLLRGAPHDPDLYDVERERQLLQVMVDFGPLVDGVTTARAAAVDGLPFERYAEVLRRIGEIVVRPATSGGV
jgi:hypothetical protein